MLTLYNCSFREIGHEVRLPPCFSKFCDVVAGIMSSVSPQQVVVRIVVPQTTYSPATSLVIRGSLNVHIHHSVLLSVIVEYISTDCHAGPGGKINLKKYV